MRISPGLITRIGRACGPCKYPERAILCERGGQFKKEERGRQEAEQFEELRAINVPVASLHNYLSQQTERMLYEVLLDGLALQKYQQPRPATGRSSGSPAPPAVVPTRYKSTFRTEVQPCMAF